ncbi:MAG: glycine cleavage system protein T [Anaerolineae bacterium]|nr:glycine cleavage system protein T [Anaerolineae bacterium]
MAATLQDVQRAAGAVFTADAPVPDHFGDLAAEYEAARQTAVLVDRSDEGRVLVSDADRLTIINRMSTNAVATLAPGEGRATVFTTPIGRIIDRVILHALDGEQTLVRTSAGRGELIAVYLRRNIFFRDRMQVQDRTAELACLALYGPAAGVVVAALVPGAASLGRYGVVRATFQDEPLWVVALDPVGKPVGVPVGEPTGVPGFGLIAPVNVAGDLWQAVRQAGAASDLRPAGRALYELLRIEAGLPGPAGELTEDYIPLEAGLWSDVSFSKGCYTGQEIIARMESRGKLAKTLVGVTLSGPVEVGMTWSAGGKTQGTLTSAALRPDGTWIGLGFVKPDVAEVGRALDVANGVSATITLAPGRDVPGRDVPGRDVSA